MTNEPKPGGALAQGWFVTSIAPRPPVHEVWLHGPAEVLVVLEPGAERCFRRVGDVGVSYRGPRGRWSESAVNAVANWLASSARPLREALRQLAPGPAQLGDDLRQWDDRVASSPRGTGFAPPSVQVAEPGVFERLRRASQVTGQRESFLAGLAMCLGGRPSLQESTYRHCSSCRDRSRCGGPPSSLDADGVARLRPSPPGDAGAQLLAAITAIGHGTSQAAAALRLVLDHVGDGRYDIFELSYKVDHLQIARGPRVTCYLPAERNDAAARGFLALASAPGASAVVDRLAAVANQLPWHFGFDLGTDGISAKLYVGVSGPNGPGDRLPALLDALGPLRGADRVATWPILMLGLTVRPSGAIRVRAYQQAPRSEVTDDPAADVHGSMGWNLSADADPVLDVRYAHYLNSQLIWPEMAQRLGLGVQLSGILGRGFSAETCRYYFTQIGSADQCKTLYAQVGPGPRDL